MRRPPFCGTNISCTHWFEIFSAFQPLYSIVSARQLASLPPSAWGACVLASLAWHGLTARSATTMTTVILKRLLHLVKAANSSFIALLYKCGSSADRAAHHATSVKRKRLATRNFCVTP